jgi:hypothetical protein
MYTFVRFALHGAGEQAYRHAFDILPSLWLDAVPGVDPAPHVHAGGACCCSTSAAAVGRVPGEPEEIVRSVFVALSEARLRPVTVIGRRVDRAPGLPC